MNLCLYWQQFFILISKKEVGSEVVNVRLAFVG